MEPFCIATRSWLVYLALVVLNPIYGCKQMKEGLCLTNGLLFSCGVDVIGLDV